MVVMRAHKKLLIGSSVCVIGVQSNELDEKGNI